MKAFERFFHGEYGGSRAYLLSKAVLLMLALDTWMLMIGHAGRYGIDGFNVAHFEWLDALTPLPSAASYIAVLLLTGLLALCLVFTGLCRIPAFALFLLYTLSWSMSMLDSYQHHYFVSLVLLCLVFFPETSALELHPPRDAESRGKKLRTAGATSRAELSGWMYVATLVASIAAYALIDAAGHSWVAFCLLCGAIAIATWFYSPETGAPRLRSGFGFSLLGVTIAIVYGFTALAKIDENWMAGHTLLRLSAAERIFAPLADLGERWGLPRDRAFATLSTLVIPQEFTLGICYLLSIPRDRSRKAWLGFACWVGFGLAIVLHVGAEAMSLQIGWFSYYMLLLGCCYLLPLSIVDRLATLFTWPGRWLDRRAQAWQQNPRRASAFGVGGLCLAMALLLLAGSRLDLPGALAASGIAASALAAVSLWGRLLHPARDRRPWAAAAALAAAGMWLVIALSPVRWDFYRFLGGDLKRRGETAAALAAYEHAERYAPPGASRKSRIIELREQLRRP
jgi:hypothetical protein